MDGEFPVALQLLIADDLPVKQLRLLRYPTIEPLYRTNCIQFTTGRQALGLCQPLLGRPGNRADPDSLFGAMP